MEVMFYWPDYGDEVEYEKDGQKVRVRLSRKGRRERISIFFYGFIGIVLGILLVFVFDDKIVVLIPISLTLYMTSYLYLVWRNDWLRAEFLADNSGLEKRFPSGKTFVGSWNELTRVQLSFKKLYFRDGSVIRMSYGPYESPGSESWDKMIAMAPKESLVAVAWKDWRAVKDTRYANYIRVLLLLGSIILALIIPSLFDISRSLAEMLPPIFILLCLVYIGLKNRIIFLIREYCGLYSIKQPIEKEEI